MVIVVPPLAEGDECQEQVVPAVVICVEALRPPEVRQAVDGVGRVPHQHHAHEEAGEQAGPSEHEQYHDARDDRR